MGIQLQPPITKRLRRWKAKGRCLSTLSFIKALVQQIATPTTPVVGNPSATPSAPACDHVASPSHSGVNTPSMTRKRKAVASDTSITSSERLSFFFIENVDMGSLIEDLMSTKAPLRPTTVSKNSLPSCVCHSFCFSIHSMGSLGYLFNHFSLQFCSTS